MATYKITGDTDPVVDCFERCIPRFVLSSSKGTYGRVAVIGGSPSYTGAPYFAGIAALHSGADLVYVFTSVHASPVIKSYSPELIVYPNLEDPTFVDLFIERTGAFSSVIIGPGLGRPGDVLSQEQFTRLLVRLKERRIPVVLDADVFSYIAKNPSMITNYKEAILTPNHREFKRLYSAVNNKDLSDCADVDDNELRGLATKLGNVTICLKHSVDRITDGNSIVSYGGSGSPRRCGGQGDLLSGMLGTFTFWTQQAFIAREQRQAETQAVNRPPQNTQPCVSSHKGINSISPTILAALGASMLVRRCARFAFEQHQRATVASNLIPEISHAFNSLFPKANQYNSP